MFDESNPNPQDQFRPEPPEIKKESKQAVQPKEVYTMPEKFIEKGPKGKSKVSKPLIIILLVVIFGGVAFGAVILFNQLSTPENANTVVLNTNRANANLDENENANSSTDPEAVKSRDSQRLSDINQFRTALTLYFDDNSTFPFTSGGELTEDIIGAYLVAVPTAPLPADGECSETENQYFYTAYQDVDQSTPCTSRNDTCLNYTITFCLGVGSSTVPAGVNTLTKDGYQTSVNANFNLNTNLNANTNFNLNTNLNANANVNTTSPPQSLDADDDGLTDIEEDLYGTGVNTPDTDGDSFIDGKQVNADGNIVGELYLGYDPTSKNARLEGTSLVKRYTNSTYNWSMLYPSKWTASQLSSATGDKSIMFSPDISTVEYMQVSVQENPTRLTAKNWYLSLNPGVTSSVVESIVVNGLDGVKSLDNATVYLSKQDKIYVITYNLGNTIAVNFQTTFEMMFQSFRLISSTTNTNTNTDSNTLNTGI